MVHQRFRADRMKVIVDTGQFSAHHIWMIKDRVGDVVRDAKLVRLLTML